MPSSALRSRSSPSPAPSTSDSGFQDSAFDDSQFLDPRFESPRPSRSTSRRCPQCGGALKRVLRSANDKRRWDADDWRRYRCRNDRCSWQGLLSVKGSRRRARTARQQAIVDASPTVRAMRAALMVALAGAVAWAGMQAVEFLNGL